MDMDKDVKKVAQNKLREVISAEVKNNMTDSLEELMNTHSSVFARHEKQFDNMIEAIKELDKSLRNTKLYVKLLTNFLVSATILAYILIIILFIIK